MEIPPLIEAQVDAMCRSLPEVTVRLDEPRRPTRSTAYAFDIRRRPFCLLVATEGPSAEPVTIIVLRAGPTERAALLATGHPYFPTRNGADRLGVVLTADSDWEEIRQLVTDSYRILAPKKLSQHLD